MFTLVILLLALSAAATIWLIDARLYDGFDGSPNGFRQRVLAIVSIPAVFLWIILEIVLKRHEPPITFGHFTDYVAWTFSKDEA